MEARAQHRPTTSGTNRALASAVLLAARNHPERPAVVTSEQNITWGEVNRSSESLAVHLAAHGVRPGDIVALSMHSGALWVVAATAINRLGGAIAGVSPVLTASERTTMVDTLRPRLVLADRDLADGLPLRTPVLELSRSGLDTSTPPVAGIGGDHLHEGTRGHTRPAYAICFTSGTTGAPKAAVFSESAAEAVNRMDLGEDPEPGSGGDVISSTQFAHVGFVLKLPGHALVGSTIHVMDRWNATEAIWLIERYRITTLGVVAPQLALILRSPALEHADLSSLRTVIAGGAPSPEPLVREAIDRLGVSYSIRWSSTESGGVGLAADISGRDSTAIGTIGSPRRGVQARIADADGTPTADGDTGELQIRSDAVMDGYLGDPDSSAAAFTPDRWLRTGDLATRRDDGRFVLAGRRSEMYIRGGYNVHPQEVEGVLATHPGVEAVAVVPRRDEVMGQIGVAVVVPAGGHPTPTLGELREHAAPVLARYKLPEDLTERDSLPITAGGKLDRSKLRAELER